MTASSDPKATQPGVVTEATSNAMYRVKLDDGPTVLAHIGSELKRYTVRIMPGDRVMVSQSGYDTSRGKIVLRGN